MAQQMNMTRHKLLAKARNPPPKNTPTENNSNTTTPTTTMARSWLRQVLDVCNLILIAFFLFKISTEFKSCESEIIDLAATEKKSHQMGSLRATDSVVAKEAISEGAEKEAAEAGDMSAAQEEEEGTKDASEIPADNSPAIAQSTPIDVNYKQLLSGGQQTNICVYASSGLGSCMIQMLAQKIFYEDRAFNFIVDDNQYGYKWDDNQGVVAGFFDTKFPVLKPDEYRTAISEPFHVPNMQQVMANRAFKVARSPDQKILAQWTINEEFRRNFVANYGKDGFPLYNRFAGEACNNLQFSAQARQAIGELIAERAGPLNLRQTHSVAFHVRRGDKVTLGESRAYSGEEYVSKLMNVLQDNNIDPTSHFIEDCFVASDSLEAVEEIKESLKNHNIDCKLHSIATRSENQAGENKGAYSERLYTVEFLAEFSLLLDATYFIGTFNSNVGSLAALLRKCHYFGAPHYAHSYGVDQEGWYYRA